MYSFIKKQGAFIFVILIAVLSVFSLFHSGLLPTHDGEYHIIRFYEFDKTLRDGNWYPLWAADLNFKYGSPLFDYVYPLPNYVTSLFHLLTLSFIDSFKANLIVATLLGAIFSYFLGREKFGKWGGVLTSVFYTFAPYHFLDIYIRGSVGEVWALAFFPLSLWMFDRVLRKRDILSMLLAGISYALIIFSHNILAVMFTGFLFTYIVFLSCISKERIKTFGILATPIIVGMLLASVFIIPALFEQQYVVGLKVFDVVQNFPELFELLIPSWGSGFSGGSLENQMSFQIGLANLLVIVLVLFGLLFRKVTKQRLEILFLFGWFVLLFFLMTPYSEFIWRNVLFMNYFQFPWRLLSLVILCVAILAGSIPLMFKSRILYMLLILFAIFSTYSYAHPPYFFERDDAYYTSRPNFIYGTNSIGDVFQTRWFSQQNSLAKLNVGTGVKYISGSTTQKVYRVNVAGDTDHTFDIAYFPGWQGYVNGQKINTKNKNGRVMVPLQKGAYILMVQLSDTPIRFFAKTLSIITFFVIFLVILRLCVIQYFSSPKRKKR